MSNNHSHPQLLCPKPLRHHSHHPHPAPSPLTLLPSAALSDSATNNDNTQPQQHALTPTSPLDEFLSILNSRFPTPSTPSPVRSLTSHALLSGGAVTAGAGSPPTSAGADKQLTRTPTRGARQRRSGSITCSPSSAAGFVISRPASAGPRFKYSPISRKLTTNPLPRHSDYALLAEKLYEMRLFGLAPDLPRPLEEETNPVGEGGFEVGTQVEVAGERSGERTVCASEGEVTPVAGPRRDVADEVEPRPTSV